MKKLVTALIIVLPLIFLVAIFAVTNIARISAEVHATSIVIANKGDDGVFTFDIYQNRLPIEEWELGVEVLPMIAKDRSYTLSITDAESGEPTDIVALREDGTFELSDIGVAKLTYTSNDGGYSDSVLFNVVTSGVLDFTPVVRDNGGKEYALSQGTSTDYEVTLPSGEYQFFGSYYPASVISSSELFSSSNSAILDINSVTGKFSAKFSGYAVVAMRVDNTQPKTIGVTVTMASDVTVNGMPAENSPKLSAGINAQAFSFALETATEISEDNIFVTGENIRSASATYLDVAAQSSGFTYGFSSKHKTFMVEVTLDAPYDSPTTKTYTLEVDGEQYEFTVEFADYHFFVYSSFNTDNADEILLLTGETTRLSVLSEPINPSLSYEISLEGSSNVQLVTQDNGVCEIKSSLAGDAVLKVRWSVNEAGGTRTGEFSRALKIINGVSSMLFKENGAQYGLGSLAIASDKIVSGDITAAPYLAGFMSYGRGNAQPAGLEDFDFDVSDPSVISVEKDWQGVHINVLSTGVASVTANWKYGERFGVKGATLTFYAVKGVAVDDRNELEYCMRQKLPVVLQNDIYLGEPLFNENPDGSRSPKYDDDTMRNKLLYYTKELKTTWDYTYYTNTGLEQPSVRYCMEFTADVFGNGHFINAEYITDMLYTESTLYSFAVLNGPLDFVAAKLNGETLAAVKGQDNIIFLNRTDGIQLNNVVLKGCDDDTILDMSNGSRSLNLSLLNYMGTTLEVMADTSVVDCRIMNGRNCVRAYGRDGVDMNSPVNADKERIRLTMDGCRIQNAREFLLKVSTNRAVRGTKDDPSPSLYDGNGREYANFNSPACDRYSEDEYFENNFVLTCVDLKDSTLSTSGLFSIGLESHFAGDWLLDCPYDFPGWTGLAATTYPAKLKLIGNVVMDDWKDIANVNSSTLIEKNSNSASLAFLTLNIADMLNCVRMYGGEEYSDLLVERNGRTYVHGGIACYGGGKNYSIIDLSEYKNEELTQYNINLKILENDEDHPNVMLQGRMLPFAAGPWDFRFVLLSGDKLKN